MIAMLRFTAEVTSFVKQADLQIPLLAVLDHHGPLRAVDAADAVAERINLDEESRTRRVKLACGSTTNTWSRTVRWAEQRTKLAGLTARDGHGRWTLGPNAHTALTSATPHVVITILEDESGVVLWGSVEAVEEHLDPGSIQAIVTSPPYPIETQKTYEGRLGNDYETWMLERLARWKTILASDGSLFLNLGDAWNRGEPTISLYQERILLEACGRLGWSLASKLYWYNPAKMPSPAQYVTIERIRLTNAVEQIYWLSPSPRPRASNRRVLRPYSKSMLRTLGAGGSNAGKRPSGFDVAEGAFSIDHGGSIPHNLIIASNTASNDGYTRGCKAAGLPVHPARFPQDLPRLFIGLGSEEGDVIWDPFGGSLTTAAVARAMNRRFVANDQIREYLEGGLIRLKESSPELPL